MPVGASVSCDSINMNNILLVNICLLAVTALVCPFQVPQNYGGDSLNAAATPPRRVSVTQSRSNFWSSTVTRERRDAERKGGPLRNSLNMCCNVDGTPEQDVYDKDILSNFTECKKENKSNEERHTNSVPIVECMAKKRNMIDDAGNLNEDQIKAEYEKMPLAEHQKGVLDTVLTTCIAKAKENTSQTEEGVNGAFYKFHRCTAREFMIACPKEKQNKSELCVRMREGKGKPKASGESAQT